MSERTLGRTGLRISALCLGCWRFGAETATTSIDHALDRGVYFIGGGSHRLRRGLRWLARVGGSLG